MIAAIALQAGSLAAGLQPLIERHETFPEIFGEAGGLTELQAVLWRAAVVFSGHPGLTEDEREPF